MGRSVGGGWGAPPARWEAWQAVTVDVARYLDDSARRWPDRVAIVDDRGPMTFRELAVAAAELRQELRQAGLRSAQGLGVIARNGRAFLIATFAGLGCGAVIMPVFHQLRRAELLAQLHEVPLHAVVDDGSIEALEGARPLGATGMRWTRLAADLSQPLVPHVPDAAFVRFTSGTTGRAKGVVLSHRAVDERTQAARQALDLGPEDTVVWVLPMAYHFVVSVVMYVRYGVRIAVCPDVFADSLIEVAAREGGTVLYASPMHYRMLAADTTGRLLPTVRYAVSTSSGLSAEVGRAFAARFGLPLRQVYGIIELGLPLGDLGDDPRPESVGYPQPGYEAAVLDELGRPVPSGVAGNLALRGPGLFDAYLSPPTSAAQVLQHGWFMTGDLAVQAEDGRLTISGRRKSMINVAGHKVFPEEVEAVLEGDPTVGAARVYGVAHAMMGEVVHAEVCPAPGMVPDPDALRRLCQERLSMHKVPQRVVVVQEVARTSTGKVARVG